MASSFTSAGSGVAVTPADDGNLDKTLGFHVGVAGDVKVDFAESGTAVVLKGCTAGTIYPYSVSRIYATDTTATDIVALY